MKRTRPLASSDDVERRVARERDAQGLPLHLYNVAALRRIAELVRSVRSGARTGRRRGQRQ